VIIVGPGMTESMLGGALSRVGKRVLQLDLNDYYGGQYRTLSLTELNSFFESKGNQITEEEQNKNKASQDNKIILNKEELDVKYTENCVSYRDAYEKIEIIRTVSDDYIQSREARKFSIDMINKVIYSNVNIVPLLIKSSMGRYMEFKCIDGVMLYTSNEFLKVPCTKGEIMASKNISLLEKRYLGKFMTFCLDYETNEANRRIYEEYAQKPFIEFLRQYHKLSLMLEDFVVFAIAMLDCKDESITTEEGMKRIQRYINSLGRYGKTAFLYPLYGISELNQAFCRVGAVYNGTYVLRRGIRSIFTDDIDESNNTVVKGITCTDLQQLSCESLIMNNDYRLFENKVDTQNCDIVIRCVALTDFPIFDEEGAYIAIVPPNIVSEKQSTSITIFQLDYRNAVAPQGKFIISFQMRSKEGEHEHAESVLRAGVQKFLQNKLDSIHAQLQDKIAEERKVRENNSYKQEERNANHEALIEQQDQKETSVEVAPEKEIYLPKILYQLYYKQYVRPVEQNQMHTFSNVFVCKDADIYLDMEDTVTEARNIFYKICDENTDFFEKLPDPEDGLSQILDEDAKMLGVDKHLVQQE
jgi:RAB protein geranylgeranyltransferase component A